MNLLSVLSMVLIFGLVSCIPVPPKQHKPDVGDIKEGEVGGEELDLQLEYQRYLKEVVDALEEDKEFSKKLSEANSTDIKTGEIAKHLDFVGHKIRTKLDEIKRKEMERLRIVAREKMRRTNGVGKVGPYDPQHLDHVNPHSFEINDLQKLIKTATQDLEKADKERKDEFKQYEMEKEHLRQEKLKGMDEEHKKKEEHNYEEMQKKHKEHPKLHHPGSEDQLKEVWEKTDHLDKEDFDPKTFFRLHDVNGDGYLEVDEVEALFQTELDKAYDPNAPEDDMQERYEEMSRMREHFLKEADKDKDGMISLEEFIAESKDNDFARDEGWDTLDDQKQYTDEEYNKFEEEWGREHAQPGEVNIPPQPDVAHMNQQGHPNAPYQQERHPERPMAHQRFEEGQVHHQQNQQEGHPGEVPMAHNRNEEGQVHHQQIPQEQQQHNQPPPPQHQQQQQHNQPPPPQQQQHNQPPPPQHQQQNQQPPHQGQPVQDQGQQHQRL